MEALAQWSEGVSALDLTGPPSINSKPFNTKAVTATGTRGGGGGGGGGGGCGGCGGGGGGGGGRGGGGGGDGCLAEGFFFVE